MSPRSHAFPLASALALLVLCLGCGQSFTPRLFSVTHGNGRYVAVGEGGVVVSSPDLRTWTPASSGTSSTLTDVQFGNGRYVAVGDLGAVLVSEDGLNWSGVTPASSIDLNAVTYSAALSLWISVGASGEVSSSPDGLTWTVRHTGSAWLADIASSDTGFLAVEAGAAGELSSANGQTWTRTAQPLGGRCAVAQANGLWVSADFDGNLHRRPTQTSSAVWQTSASGMWTAGNECDLAAGEDFFVVVNAAQGTLFTSPDGLAWTQKFRSENALRGVLTVGSEVVTVGSFGELAHARCPGGACGEFTEDPISIPGEAPASPDAAGSTGGVCAYWSCGTSKQCESVMGGKSGRKCSFGPGQTCQQWCADTIPGNCSCR